jgi:amidase
MTSAFVPHDLKAALPGAADGPLAGFTVAVKDMYDIAGERTGAGNPEWLADQAPAEHTAVAVRRLLAAGATVIGKTVCDEFFFSVSGANAHYGTPINPRAAGRLPGGSSAGSAAATAAGACDFALGSDTGGSVRVPASFCGIYGIRPTLGRVDGEGAMAMAPSFDTVGWFAGGPGLLRKVGDVLLGGYGKQAKLERMLIGSDCFAGADSEVAQKLKDFLARAAERLPRPEAVTIAPQGTEDWRNAFRVIQGREIWAIYGDWMTARKPQFGPGVRERIAYAATVTEPEAQAARAVHQAARAHIRVLLPPGTVLALPSAPAVAPRTDCSAEEMDSFRTRVMSLTCLSGLSGLPQVSLPVANVQGCPVGLSFIGWEGGDEDLLDLAVTLGRFCGE